MTYIETGNYPVAGPYSDIKEEDMDKPHVYYNEAAKDTPSIPNDAAAIGPNMLELEEHRYTSLLRTRPQ